ncbi:C-terminal helicase domain-containing protein [uncultured Chitinophaga sp.]|uniref:C-terminal helicase domain-containing protein n=1 Tax=Chitinophaga sp. TaxID=1869181 RepID=UPI0034588F4C
MPEKMRKLALKILQDPIQVNIAISKPPERIKQEAFVVHEEQKVPLVKHILSSRPTESVIVFCSRKQNVKTLAAVLRRGKFTVEEIHSDLEQDKREQSLLNFKNGKSKVLVATDILSRGIDIEDIDLVINYDVPNDGEDYIHRIGRTARAATDGTAYTFISPKEQGRFSRIEELLGKPVDKATVPPELGPVPEYTPKVRRPGGGGGNNRGGGQHRGGSGGGQGKPRNGNKRRNNNNRPKQQKKP